MNFFQQLIETYNKGKLYDKLVGDFNIIDNILEDTLDTVDDLEEQVKTLEAEYLLLAEQINPVVLTFKPSWLVSSAVYPTCRRFVSKNYDEIIYFKKPQDVFDESVYLNTLLSKKNYMDMDKTVANGSKIYKYLVSLIDYEHDRTDNWRPVTETLLAGKGDCDDSAVVLVSAFGMAGWKADEVFLGIGYYVKENGEKFYHAWCNVKINGKWYIAEGTDQYDKLKLWSSNKEKYLLDEVWNWKWNGLLISSNKYFSDE